MSRRVGSRGDLTSGGNYHYARSEVVHGAGNGFEPYTEGYNTYTFSKTSMGGIPGGMEGGMMSSSMRGGMQDAMMGGGMGGEMSGGMMMSTSVSGGMMGGGMRYECVHLLIVQVINVPSARCHLLPLYVTQRARVWPSVQHSSWLPLNINHDCLFCPSVHCNAAR